MRFLQPILNFIRESSENEREISHRLELLKQEEERIGKERDTISREREKLNEEMNTVKEDWKNIEKQWGILCRERQRLQQINPDIQVQTEYIQLTGISPIFKKATIYKPPISKEIEKFPKKCINCPDSKEYNKGEIHECPTCHKWLCGKHYHPHVMKNHQSLDYVITSGGNLPDSVWFPR